MTTRSTHKVRLVVGLFGMAGEVTAALADLAARQIGRDRIRLVTRAHAQGGALGAGPAVGDAGLGFGTRIVCRPVEGAFPWALHPADSGSAHIMAVDDVRALLELHHWPLRRQAGRLDRQLRGGGALVLVQPATDAEERDVCTALLRHASGGVQTHEITRAQGREQGQ